MCVRCEANARRTFLENRMTKRMTVRPLAMSAQPVTGYRHARPLQQRAGVQCDM
jgi:hypothetical protein